MRKLERKADGLEATVEKQNVEIANLIVQYQSLKLGQVFKKAKLDGEIRDALAMQYAAVDYISMLIGTIQGERQMSQDDVRFYKVFGKYVDGKDSSDDNLEAICSYARERHAYEISHHLPCDTRSAFKDLREQAERQKRESSTPKLPFGKRHSETNADTREAGRN